MDRLYQKSLQDKQLMVASIWAQLLIAGAKYRGEFSKSGLRHCLFRNSSQFGLAGSSCSSHGDAYRCGWGGQGPTVEQLDAFSKPAEAGTGTG